MLNITRYYKSNLLEFKKSLDCVIGIKNNCKRKNKNMNLCIILLIHLHKQNACEHTKYLHTKVYYFLY